MTELTDSLIIFIKNPELGNVKTRLAATMGDKKALEIYEKLLLHTESICTPLRVDKYLFYSKSISTTDHWDNVVYSKQLQHSSYDLGIKMHDSFLKLQKKGAKKVLIIGSDCPELTTKIIEDAFVFLETNNAVIGPSTDGGYYALGIRFEGINDIEKMLKSLFLNRKWSHAEVYNEALDVFQNHKISFEILPTLTDIDTEEDLKNTKTAWLL